MNNIRTRMRHLATLDRTYRPDRKIRHLYEIAPEIVFEDPPDPQGLGLNAWVSIIGYFLIMGPGFAWTLDLRAKNIPWGITYEQQ